MGRAVIWYTGPKRSMEELLKRIGVFDSGVGGLSVWREIRRALPHIDTVYVADQEHIPYGPLAPARILEYSLQMSRFLERQGCEVIVVACNTASAAALQALRSHLPHLEFVGMEPAIKPAAEVSRSGVVVVLATANTLEGELFQRTSRQYAAGVRVLAQPCPGLVEQIERGETDTAATRELLRVFLEQPLLAGADVCVLGCTHYAFVHALLEELLPEKTRIIDPAAAVARRVQRLAENPTAAAGHPSHGSSLGMAGEHALWTTASVETFTAVASHLLQESITARHLRWTPDGLLP